MLKQLENILQNEIDPAFAKRARFIFEQVEKERPKKVLDAGCGRGFYVTSLTYFKFIKEIHGFDLNEKYLKIAKKSISGSHSGERSQVPDGTWRCDSRIDSGRVTILQRTRMTKVVLQQASIYSLPYPSSYFDFIICSEVLEHLKDDKKALLELRRVLKKDGTLAITIPNKDFPFLWDPLNWILMKLFKTHINKDIWWLAGIWADHERLYSENELKKTISDSRFRIKQMRKIIHWCWPFTHFLLYGVGKNLIERFGIKAGNRFNQSNNSKISRFLSCFMAMPSNLFDNLSISSSMNIAVLTEKN